MEHKYDVAISFLSDDEEIAQELYELLSPSLRVFIFTKRQDDVAGTNGLDTFRRVFRSDSSLVVVLYRDGWGETPWTRVEKIAIEERFLKDGPEFLFIVSLSSKSTPPPWIPDTLIRFNLDDYGIDQAVGVIKRRAQEGGVIFRKETSAERALRTEEKIRFQEETDRLFHLEQGVQLAKESASQFAQELCKKVEEASEAAPVLEMRSSISDLNVRVSTSRVSAETYFRVRFSNSLDDAALHVLFLRGPIILHDENRYYLQKPERILELKFNPVRTKSQGWCWKDPNGQLRTSTVLAEYIMELILAKSEEIS